jgi:hypothetical protein
LFALHARDSNLLLQSRAAITAAGAVDLDHAFVSVVGKLGTRNPGCAAGDLQHVAGPSTRAQQIGWRQSRNGVANVFDARFCNTQFQCCRGNRWGNFLVHVTRIATRDGHTGHVICQVSQF